MQCNFAIFDQSQNVRKIQFSNLIIILVAPGLNRVKPVKSKATYRSMKKF